LRSPIISTLKQGETSGLNLAVFNKSPDVTIRKDKYVVMSNIWFGCVEEYRKDSKPNDIVGTCFKHALKNDTKVIIDLEGDMYK